MPKSPQQILQLVSLLLLTLPLQASQVVDTIPNTDKIIQTGIEVKGKIDKLLDVRDNRSKAGVDTNYLQRAPVRLRLKLTVNASGSDIITRGHSEAGDYRSTLKAQNKYTVSLSASYRGLTLGAALNPAHLAGKNKDYEFNMNAYGNSFGADVIFQSANTFKGNIESAKGNTTVPTGLVRQNMLQVNTYYVLNKRRFSYPAAFSQSWIQRRSSGSFMIGASFRGGNLRVRHSDVIGNTAARLSFADVGVGAGYGYNWVIKSRWLVHLSTFPQLVVFSRNRLKTEDGEEKTPYKFPSVIAIGRMAVVRHFDRWLVGMTTVVNTSSAGDHDQLQLSTVKWRARVFVGIKLNKKQ